MEDVSSTNPEAYSASLANVVFVLMFSFLFFFLYPGSHSDGVVSTKVDVSVPTKKKTPFPHL